MNLNEMNDCSSSLDYYSSFKKINTKCKSTFPCLRSEMNSIEHGICLPICCILTTSYIYLRNAFSSAQNGEINATSTQNWNTKYIRNWGGMAKKKKNSNTKPGIHIIIAEIKQCDSVKLYIEVIRCKHFTCPTWIHPQISFQQCNDE